MPVSTAAMPSASRSRRTTSPSFRPRSRSTRRRLRPAPSAPCCTPFAPSPRWRSAIRFSRSNTEITGPYVVIRAQLFRAGRIDHLALAHDVHVVDELERQGGVLLDQQDGEAFGLELSD